MSDAEIITTSFTAAMFLLATIKRIYTLFYLIDQTKSPLTFPQAGFCVNNNLASSYFDRRLPSNYRRRNSVSPLSSGWDQCGSTAPSTPGKTYQLKIKN